MLGQRCITTPAGVRIGIAYEPPKLQESSYDAEWLQCKILGVTPPKPPKKPRKRGLFTFWRAK